MVPAYAATNKYEYGASGTASLNNRQALEIGLLQFVYGFPVWTGLSVPGVRVQCSMCMDGVMCTSTID